MRFSTLLLTISFLVFTTLSSLSAQNLEIYVSDAGNFNNPPWQILKFDENGQNPEVYINSNLSWPQDILFLEDQGIVLISNLSSNRINKHAIEDGAFLGSFATGISGPTRMKIGADGLLYVLQWNGDYKVKRYQLDGTFVDNFTEVGVPRSIGLDWDKDGNLYVSSYNTDLVRKFGLNGEDLGVFINTNLLGPTNIWFDENGDLLVSDYDGTAIKRFNSEGVYQGDFIGGLRNSEGVAFFPNGDILIGNGQTRSVKMYDSNGNYIKDLIPSGSGNLLTPNAVVLRDPAAVSIEGLEHNTKFTYPTIGKSFTFNVDAFSKISSIEVYNSAGILVEKMEAKDRLQLIWEASEFSKGVYIAIAKVEGRTIGVQKLVVE